MSGDYDHRARAMSLVPYAPEQSREIVLRHNNTVVLFDPSSQEVSLRTAPHTRCPTCHRAFRDESPHRAEPAPGPHKTSYMDPAYFQFLAQSLRGSNGSRPSSPRRRLADVSRAESSPIRPPPGAKFVASEPRVQEHGISSRAFQPGYFKNFFQVEKELGRGGKGVVLLVSHDIDGVHLGTFALKRVPVGDDHSWLEKVLVEVQTLQKLSHPNLVAYRHVWLEPFQVTSFGPQIPCAFILQQYCNDGDLHNYVLGTSSRTPTKEQLKERMRRRSKGTLEQPRDIRGVRNISFDEIYSFFKDITDGLHHLHSNGFIHRDIKPSNCLLHTAGSRTRVLLSDFGEVQGADATRVGTGATGTVSYCAPEVLRHDSPSGSFGNFSVKSDIFSLGMVVYFMAFGALPYSDAAAINEDREDVDTLRAEIVGWTGLIDEHREQRTDLPDQLYTFLKRLLAVDPDDRPSTEEILHEIRAVHDPDLASAATNAEYDGRKSPRIKVADSSGGSNSSPFEPPILRRSISAGHHNATHPALTPSSALAPPATFADNSTTAIIRARKRSDAHASQYDGGEYPQPRQRQYRASSPARDMYPYRETSPYRDAASSPTTPRAPTTTTTGTFTPHPALHPSAPLFLPAPPPRRRRHTRLSLLAASPFLPSLLRILLFLGKYHLLTAPCAPRAPPAEVVLPLLALALLDFAGGVGRRKVGATVVLMLMHGAVVLALGEAGVMCGSGGRRGRFALDAVWRDRRLWRVDESVGEVDH